MNGKVKNKKNNNSKKPKIIATDQLVPDDEKTPVTVNDPDDTT